MKYMPPEAAGGTAPCVDQSRVIVFAKDLVARNPAR